MNKVHSLATWHVIRTINSRKSRKFKNTWILDNILLNNWGIEEEIKREITNYIEMNENENAAYKTYADKVVFKEKCITINVYIEKEKIS